MKTKTMPETEIKKTVINILDEVLAHPVLKGIRFKERKTETTSFSVVSLCIASRKETKKFNWIDDPNEEQYDAWSIIDDCPLLDKCNAYAKTIMQKYKVMDLELDIIIEGVKDEFSVVVHIMTS